VEADQRGRIPIPFACAGPFPCNSSGLFLGVKKKWAFHPSQSKLPDQFSYSKGIQTNSSDSLRGGSVHSSLSVANPNYQISFSYSKGIQTNSSEFFSRTCVDMYFIKMKQSSELQQTKNKARPRRNLAMQ
jgi:hypothetical protein